MAAANRSTFSGVIRLLRVGLGVGKQGEGAGEPVRLSPKAAGLISLVIHELAFECALCPPEPVRVEWTPADAGLKSRRLQSRARAGPARMPDWLGRAIEYELGGSIERVEADDTPIVATPVR